MKMIKKEKKTDVCRICVHRNKKMISYTSNTNIFCNQWQIRKKIWDTCNKFKKDMEEIDELYLPDRLID